MTLLLIFLALAPSMVWMYWIWRKDSLRREPLRLTLGLFFGGGLLSVVLTLLIVSLYSGYIPATESSPIMHMLLAAAFPEEMAKMLPVLLFAWRSRHWDEPFDGIVYAGATALGFNLIETALYMIGEERLVGSVFQGLVRGTLGGHMVYGIIMGYYLSRAKFGRGLARLDNLFLALAVPVVLHTTWNAALVYGGDIIDGNTLPALFAWGLSTVLWVTAFELIRRNREGARVEAAGRPCDACGGAYPARARFCQTCGAPVGIYRGLR